MSNWRGVFAAPGITQAQRDALVDLMTRMNTSNAWRSELDSRKWSDVFLTERPFEREIEANIKLTETVLKDLGLA
jgi:putative tricarboxylic transport membrane protein